MKKQTLAFAISMLLLAPAVAHAEGIAEEPPPTTEAPQHVSTAGVVSRAEQIRSTIVIHKKSRPPKAFWDKLAQCETAQNWKDRGKWAGGLGIYVGTWNRFGGREFAKHPSGATREEQIIVANRIAVEGYQTKSYRTLDDKLNNKPYFQPAVGLGGWGCYKSKATGKYRMAKPRYYHAEEPSLVPHAKFAFGEKNRIVRDLQTWLLLPVNGKYDKETRRWHLRWLKKRGYSTEGVPPIPVKSPPTSVVPS
jgi:hypothetical protein